MINDDAFARMVAEDVKNKIAPSQKQDLLKEENWERWKTALVMLSDNLDAQMADIEDDAAADDVRYGALGPSGVGVVREAKKAYDNRSLKIKRFKFHVDKRLDEVMQMVETGIVGTSDGWAEVDFLKKGINRHRSLMREYDLEDTGIDRALWATLDDKWCFDDITSDSI